MSLATNTAWLQATADKVRSKGYKVDFERGWETRSNGSAAPDHEGIVVHHTGADTTSTAYLRDGEKGRTMLPPYAQVHIRRDATVVIIAAGGASHAGYVDQGVWQRIIGGTAPLDRDMAPGPDSKTFSPNRPGLGIEVNGSGGPGDWTPQQRAAVVAFCAAYHQVRGWTAPRVGAHKELTRRKPGDPYAPMGPLRTDIRNTIQEEDMPLSESDFARIDQIIQSRAGWTGAGAPMIPNLYSGGAEWPATALGALQRRLTVESLGPILATTISAVGAGLDGDAIAAKVRAAVESATTQSAEALLQVAEQMRLTIETAGEQIATEARDRLTAQLRDLEVTLRPEVTQ